MKLIYSFIIFFLFSFLFSQSNSIDSIKVNITVKNFKSNSGTARLLLFNNDVGFPAEEEKAIYKTISTIENRSAVFEIFCIDGNYAVTIHHDENNNEKVDTTWYGKPDEGFGVSNDPKSSFGPPDYEDSEIRIDNKNKAFTITMRYF